MNEKLIRELGRGQRAEILAVLKRRGGMSVKELAAHFHLSYMGLKGPCLELERGGYLDTFRRPVPLGRPELAYRLTRRSHELFPGAGNQFTAEILETIQQTYGPAAPTKLLFALFAQRAKSYRARLDAAPADADADAHPTGSPAARRAEHFARLRDADGYMAEFDPGKPPDHADGAAPAGRAHANGTLAAASSISPPLPPRAASAGSAGRTAPSPRDPNQPPPLPSLGSALPAARPLPAVLSPVGMRIVEHGSPIEDIMRRYPIIERLERELFEQVLNLPVQREEDTRTPGVYRCVFHLGASGK